MSRRGSAGAVSDRFDRRPASTRPLGPLRPGLVVGLVLASDVIVRIGCEPGLGEDLLVGEDLGLGPDGEGERVGRPRIDLDLHAVPNEMETGVVGLVGELGDHDADDPVRRAGPGPPRTGRA